MAEHNKNDIKARRIILEGVRDHIVPHIHEKKIAYDMYQAILKLYQSNSDPKSLSLKEKLRSIRMRQDDPNVTYLSRFTQGQDELGGVGEVISNHARVSLSLLGLHKFWKGFQDVVSGRDKFPNWERFWTDCIYEEI